MLSVTHPLTSTITQMAVMVVDLLMSYGVVDSGSVMAWILTPQMHALYPSCDCAAILLVSDLFNMIGWQDVLVGDCLQCHGPQSWCLSQGWNH